MSRVTPESQNEQPEREKEEAISQLEQIIKENQEGNFLLNDKLEFAVDTLTSYIQKYTFYSANTRKQKYEEGEKFGQLLLDKGIIGLFCKTVVLSKTHLPEIPSTTSAWIDLLLEVTNYSPGVGDRIMNYDGVLDYFKAFLEGLLEPLNEKQLSTQKMGYITVVSGIVHNCCTCCDKTISVVRKSNILDILKKLLKSPGSDVLMTGMILTAAVADIMDEDDSDSLLQDGDDARVQIFIAHMNESLNDVTGSFNGWFTFELCRVIRQLASYDSNKKRLVDLGALEVLVRAAKCKDDYTQQEAVKALSHLSFDADCQQKMIDAEEIPVIDTLIELAKSSDEQVQETAYGAVWTMYEKLRTSEKYAEKVESVFTKKTKGHVMISYSRGQRQLLLEIRAQLEKNNFVVWMDVDQMRGDVYERMAEAVENASVVLLGMSRDYKMSEYCRREAAYAGKLNKQIIPLKVERDYDPDGWLGLMTAGMFFYDYGRKSFEEMSTKLIQELHRRAYTGDEAGVEQKIIPDAHGSSYSTPQPMSRLPSLQDNVQKFKNFDKVTFEKWLDKYNLPRDRFEAFRPKDILYLVRMKKEAPEAYYTLGPRLFKDKTNKLRKTQIMADLTDALDEFL